MSASVVAVLVMLAVAACGGSASSAQSPKLTALSYFPASTPLLATIVTDPHSTAVERGLAQARRSPTWTPLVNQLMASLAKQGVTYSRDVRPLLGNPIAFGLVGSLVSSPPAASSPFLVAWVTHSASALRSLVSKLHVRAAGTHDGAKLYTSSSAAAAVDGATLLLANSSSTITAALDRHSQGSGFSSAAYARDTTGLDPNAILTAFGDLTSALASTRAAPAGKVPWVAAIRGYGVSITGGQSQTTLRYRIDTGGRRLTGAELPIAAGSAAPALAGTMPIQMALHDPAQSVGFLIAAIQAAAPATYARLVAAEAAVKASTGISVDSLIASLTGDLQVQTDGHTMLVSVGLSNPSAMASALAKLAQLAADSGGSSVRSLGRGFYSLRIGKRRVTVGIVSGRLVAGNATQARLTAFAAAPASAAPPGGGAVAFRVAVPQLLGLALHGAASATVQQLVSMLGDLTGTVQAAPGALSGTATLATRQTP